MSSLDDILNCIGEIDASSLAYAKAMAQLATHIRNSSSVDELPMVAMYLYTELQSTSNPRQIVHLVHAARSLLGHVFSAPSSVSASDELSSELSTLCETVLSFLASSSSSTSEVKLVAASAVAPIARCTTSVLAGSSVCDEEGPLAVALCAAIRDPDSTVVIAALDALSATVLYLHSSSISSNGSALKQQLVSDLCSSTSDQSLELNTSPAATDALRRTLAALSHVSSSVQKLASLVPHSHRAANAACGAFSFDSITSFSSNTSSRRFRGAQRASVSRRNAILAAVEGADDESLLQRSVFVAGPQQQQLQQQHGAALSSIGALAALSAEDKLQEEAELQDKIDAVLRSLKALPDASSFDIERWHHDGLRFMQRVAALTLQQAELERLQENERRGMAGIPVGQLLSSLPSHTDTLDVAQQLHDNEQLRTASLVMLVREALAAYHSVARRDQARSGAVLARLISKLPGHCIDRVLDDSFDTLRRQVRDAVAAKQQQQQQHQYQAQQQAAAATGGGGGGLMLTQQQQQQVLSTVLQLSDFPAYRLVVQVLYAQYAQLAMGGDASSSSAAEDAGQSSPSAARRRRQNNNGSKVSDEADGEIFEQQLDFMTNFQRETVLRANRNNRNNESQNDGGGQHLDGHELDDEDAEHHNGVGVDEDATIDDDVEEVSHAAAGSRKQKRDAKKVKQHHQKQEHADNDIANNDGDGDDGDATSDHLLRFFSRVGVDATRLGCVDFFNMKNPIAWISASSSSHQQAQLNQILSAASSASAENNSGDDKQQQQQQIMMMHTNLQGGVFVASGGGASVVPVVTSKAAIAFEDEPARLAGRTALGHSTLRLLHLALDLAAMEMRLVSTDLHTALAHVFMDLPVVPTSAWLFLHVHLCSGKMAGELGGMGAKVLCLLGLRVLSFLAVGRPTDSAKAVSMMLHYTRSAEHFPRKASVHELMQLLRHGAVCSLTVRPAIGRFALHSAATVTTSCQQTSSSSATTAAASTTGAASGQQQQQQQHSAGSASVTEEKRAVELSRHISLAAAVATIDIDVASELIKLLLEIFATEPSWRPALLRSKELELLVEGLCASHIDDMLAAVMVRGGAHAGSDHAAAGSNHGGSGSGVIPGSEPLITFILTVATRRIFTLSRTDRVRASICAHSIKRHCDELASSTGDARFYCPASAFFTTRELRERILPAAINCFDVAETVADGEAALRNCVHDTRSFLSEEDEGDDGQQQVKETRGMSPDELLEYLILLSTQNQSFSSKAQQQAIATLVRLSTKTEHGSPIWLVSAPAAQRVLIELKKAASKPRLLMRTINMLLARESHDIREPQEIRESLRRFAAAVARDLVLEEIWSREPELWRGVQAYLEQEAERGSTHIQVVLSSLPRRILQDLCSSRSGQHIANFVKAQPDLRDVLADIM